MVRTQSGTNGGVLRIGIGAPLSGKGADLGLEMAQAAQMAVDDTNQGSLLSGIRLEAWPLDDAGTEEKGLEVARAFAADKDVIAVVGHYNSNVMLCVGSLYHRAGLPLIGPIVSNPKLTESGWSNVFRFTNGDDATAAAISAYMIEHCRKRRAVVVVTDTVYGTSMGEQFARAFERRGGAIPKRYRVREGQIDFTELVTTLPEDLDSVFYGGTFEGAPLLKALRSQGLSQILATGDGCWDVTNFLEPAGVAAESGEGVLVLSACPELGTVPGSEDFARRYTKRFGPIRNYAVNCYDATVTLVDALRFAIGSGPVDRSRMLDALRRTERRGIAYPEATRWDEKGNNISAVTALHIVKDRRFHQVAVTPRS